MRQILLSDAVAVCALFIVSKKNNTVLLKYFILEVFIVLRNFYSPKIKKESFNQSSLHSIQCFFVRNSQNLTLVRSYLVCADKGKACEAYVKGTISVKNITEVTRVIVLQ